MVAAGAARQGLTTADNPSTPALTHARAAAPPTLRTQVREPSAVVEHEASTSKIGEDQLFYFQSRGVEPEAAVGMIISGFCREVCVRACVLACVLVCVCVGWWWWWGGGVQGVCAGVAGPLCVAAVRCGSDPPRGGASRCPTVVHRAPCAPPRHAPTTGVQRAAARVCRRGERAHEPQAGGLRGVMSEMQGVAV
jgi:hypothetical protein